MSVGWNAGGVPPNIENTVHGRETTETCMGEYLRGHCMAGN